MTKNVPISHQAMLVSLNIRAWKGSATDRNVAAKAEASHEAEHGSMTVIKKLCPDYVIQPIRSATTLGRTEHYKMTVPGLFRGQHLLSTAMFETYAMTQRTIKDEFDSRVENFVDKFYPKIVEGAQRRFGQAFRKYDFPDARSMRTYFEYTIQYAPVPESRDWRLEGLAASDTDELRKEVEDGVTEMYRSATAEVYQRVRLTLENLVKQAENYSLDAPGAMLRDATIENIREMSGLVTALNVTGDPLLDKIGKEMVSQFSKIEGSDLRKNADRRSEIAGKAKAMLTRLNAVKKAA